MTKQIEYVPGICNIGKIEVESRRRTGVSALVFTLLTLLTLIIFDVPALVYIVLALPTFVAATSLLQARQNFCAGFGASGLYNFSDELGKTSQAASVKDRLKDKKKAINITIQAGTIAILTSIVAAVLSMAI